MIEQLQFDAESHTYRMDGALVPSVTNVLSDLSAREYRMVDAATMARAAWLGSAAHLLIKLDTDGTLDEEGLDEQLVPYLAQWRQFRAQSGFVPIISEQVVCSKRYRYAGTLDLFGILHGEATLIDAKRCASVPKTTGPQTAGYEIALRECLPDVVRDAASGSGDGRIRRFALHLTPERWKLAPFTDPNDTRVFLSALTLNQWSNAA